MPPDFDLLLCFALCALPCDPNAIHPSISARVVEPDCYKWLRGSFCRLLVLLTCCPLVCLLQGAHEMILEMVAWRDPNVVAVAAFYGDDLKVNFAGKLATDSHPQAC
jgi:hypothetical protein